MKIAQTEGVSTTPEAISTPQIARFTYEEALKIALDYYNGEELPAKAYIDKYAVKNAEGYILEPTPDDMHLRMAKEFARAESFFHENINDKFKAEDCPLSKYGKERGLLDVNKIYSLFKDFKYIIPQGSVMAILGNKSMFGSLSNCIVLPAIEDSYGGILYTDQQLVQLSKRRSGIGIDLSTLRPEKTPVTNAAGTSTGPVSFMHRFSNSTREVAQEGRRGALMLTIDVAHPDVEKFVTIKQDLNQVTGANISVRLSDEFMIAVRDDKEYTHKFPVDSDNPKITKTIRARDLWNTMIKCAHNTAEPGLMFWDRQHKYSPSSIYPGFKNISTNPCLAGETLVMLADGRGAVSIKSLADEGKDVPVYALDSKGKLAIRKMVNPRITGHQKQIYKITFDDGSIFRTTGNHQFFTTEGIYKKVEDFKKGDSIAVAFKEEYAWNDKFKGSNSTSYNYFWLKNIYGVRPQSPFLEHRFIYEHNNGKIDKGNVVHHKDINSLNNAPENLQSMTKKDHDKLHGDLMKGELNPIFKVLADPIKAAKYKLKQSILATGDQNSRFSGFTDKQILDEAVFLTKQLGRRFSLREWQDHALVKGMPQTFSEYRNNLGSPQELSKIASDIVGLKNQDDDPRRLETKRRAESQGYATAVMNNVVKILRKCEECGTPFWTQYDHREIGFCSSTCSNLYLNRNTDVNGKRTLSINNTYKNKAESHKDKQIKAYLDLKSLLQREPMLMEFEDKCKQIKLPYRFKTKYGFRKYADLKQIASTYNHRVVSVELDGFEDVYTGTVDEFHNYFIVGKETINKHGKRSWPMFNNLQCGELSMQGGDSCRLIALNLFGFVNNAFKESSQFDFEKFYEVTYESQRLMDDLVELELEGIQRIISKIKNDPESDKVKAIELETWQMFYDMGSKGRRTGLGFTALADCLASMGIAYDSKEGMKLIDEIMRTKLMAEFDASIDMAITRGKFEGFSPKIDNTSEFVQMMKNNFPDQYNRMMKYGRRNISISTVAPTGTLSILAQSSSGLEPVFMLSYKRRKKITPSDKNARIDFTDAQGDKWQEFPVYHPKLKMWMDVTGEKDETKSPFFGSTAPDIDWIKRVQIQSIIQKYVTHSISSTINLPNDVSVEKVGEIYMEAWEQGLKGVTVYRDGSRNGVLISDKKEEKKEIEAGENNAPKRPKTLECDVLRFNNEKEKWIAFVGMYKGRPYEIFTGKATDMKIPASVEKGKIVKVKTPKGNQYDFVYEKDGEEVKEEQLNKTFDKHYWSYAKLISVLLRHNVHLHSAITTIDSLPFDNDHILTWKAGVVRALKKYIANGTKVTDKKCKDCGAEDSVVYQEGCLVCNSCGSSKCG